MFHLKIINSNKVPRVQICRRLECFPDVWSLKEGRNWLTPSHLPKRFDTAFFIVALDQTPPTLVDQKEMSEIKVRLHEATN